MKTLKFSSTDISKMMIDFWLFDKNFTKLTGCSVSNGRMVVNGYKRIWKGTVIAILKY